MRDGAGSDTREAIRRAEYGFNLAFGRLAESGPKHHFVPLAEFCWWAISLDEGLGELRVAYRAERNEDPDGQVVAGLRRVRNVIGHERLVVTRQEGGLRVPFSLPFTIPPIVAYWVDADSLPAPKTKSERGNDQNYRRYLEGRRLDETTEGVRRWLNSQVTEMNRESGYYD